MQYIPLSLLFLPYLLFFPVDTCNILYLLQKTGPEFYSAPFVNIQASETGNELKWKPLK